MISLSLSDDPKFWDNVLLSQDYSSSGGDEAGVAAANKELKQGSVVVTSEKEASYPMRGPELRPMKRHKSSE